jgi:hypothetical protein
VHSANFACTGFSEVRRSARGFKSRSLRPLSSQQEHLPGGATGRRLKTRYPEPVILLVCSGSSKLKMQ